MATSARWTTADLPDQTGRTIVVTGANSGLGKVAATELAAKGAHVVLACRNLEKAQAAADSMRGSTEVRALDLSDLASIRAFAADLPHERIDVLVNNAGVMAPAESRTPEGWELQLATNVVGHFLLTNLLLPRITDRVVWLSSLAHRFGTIDLSDLTWQQRRYDRWRAYGQSKLADLMLAYELQRRLTAAGSDVRSVAAHPGYSATNLQDRPEQGWQRPALRLLNRMPFVQGADLGALPVLYASTVADLPGGSYIGPDGPLEARGYPRPVGSSAASHDRETARGLWARCEDLTGGPFTVR